MQNQLSIASSPWITRTRPDILPENVCQMSGIEDILRPAPGTARHTHAEFHQGKLCRGVCVSIDHKLNSKLAGTIRGSYFVIKGEHPPL